MDLGPYNSTIFACLRGLPVAAVVRFVARPRIRSAGANLPKALVGGLLGAYGAWHVGLAVANGADWSPLWSPFPVGLAEFAAYLSSILELKQDCVARRGSLFILPGGVEVRVPLTSPLTGLAAAFLGALALLLIGRPARIEFLVTLFRQDLIIIGLNIVGVIALLDIPFMAFRIASIPNKK